MKKIWEQLLSSFEFVMMKGLVICLHGLDINGWFVKVCEFLGFENEIC